MDVVSGELLVAFLLPSDTRFETEPPIRFERQRNIWPTTENKCVRFLFQTDGLENVSRATGASLASQTSVRVDISTDNHCLCWVGRAMESSAGQGARAPYG